MSFYMTCKRCKPVPNFSFNQIFRSRFLSIRQTRKRTYNNVILEASPYACNNNACNNDERKREDHIMNIMNIKVTTTMTTVSIVMGNDLVLFERMNALYITSLSLYFLFLFMAQDCFCKCRNSSTIINSTRGYNDSKKLRYFTNFEKW